MCINWKISNSDLMYNAGILVQFSRMYYMTIITSLLSRSKIKFRKYYFVELGIYIRLFIIRRKNDFEIG